LYMKDESTVLEKCKYKYNHVFSCHLSSSADIDIDTITTPLYNHIHTRVPYSELLISNLDGWFQYTREKCKSLIVSLVLKNTFIFIHVKVKPPLQRGYFSSWWSKKSISSGTIEYSAIIATIDTSKFDV
jgi:hypothetical protein